MAVELSNLSANLDVGDKAGGNFTRTETDGTMQAQGDAKCWQDLRVPVFSTQAAGSSPPTRSVFKNDGTGATGTTASVDFLSETTGNLTIPDQAAYVTNADWSFEFWVQPNVDTDNFVDLVAKAGVFSISFRNAGLLALSAVNMGFSNTSVALDNGNWNHVCITLEAGPTSTYRVYVDNQLAATISSAGSPVDNTADIIFNGDETPFGLDYVAIWDKQLSVSEISDRYNGGAGAPLVGNEANLVGLWELNDGSGSVAVDKTTASNNATISGGEGVAFDWAAGHVDAASQSSKGVLLDYFSSDTNQELYFTAQLPHEWAVGTDLHPHVHVVMPNNGGAGEKVRWGLEYTWAEVNGTFGDTSIVYAEDNSLAEDILANKHYVMPFPAISPPGPGISSMLVCRIFRDAENVADTYPDQAGLLELDFHIETDMIGSRGPFAK